MIDKKRERSMKIRNVLLSIFCFAYSLQQIFPEKSAQVTIQALYKTIGDQLVEIREQFPDSQAQVYGVLDRIGQLYSIAKKKREKVNQMKELLKTKDLENISLQNEVVSLKSELDATQSKVDETFRNLAHERARSFKLAEEKEKLVLEKNKETQELLRSAQEVQFPEDVKKELLEEPQENQKSQAKIELKPIEIRKNRRAAKQNLLSKLKETVSKSECHTPKLAVLS